MKSLVLRLAAVVSVGIGASACSSVPDWVDPTTWLENKSPPAADNGKATDLADIPGKPRTSTPDEQKQVADSLAADRAQSNYSAEQLRADAEQSAAPPPPPSPPDSASPAPAPETNKDEVSAPERTASTRPTSYTATPRPAPAETPAPAEPAEATPAPTEAPATASAPAAAQADSSLGFQQSSAPALDPSVSQFAPPAVISRYQQTASASVPPAASAPQPATPASTGVAAGAPAAVVLFPGDGIALDATARAKVRDVAAAYQSNGANGFVRVVGHSSSRTANMPVQQHIEVVFQRSQDRANAVASELIRDGVPAAKVLVEAVGDSQPIYTESMPKGEAGNRRAEIFFQS